MGIFFSIVFFGGGRPLGVFFWVGSIPPGPEIGGKVQEWRNRVGSAAPFEGPASHAGGAALPHPPLW